MCLVVQSCPTLCDPMGCSLQAPLSMGILQARITGVGCHALQGIFPTQGSNPGFRYCRRIVYCLSHQGSPRILEWVAYPFLQGIFRIQESNQSLLHCRWLFYQLSYKGSPRILEWVAYPFLQQIFLSQELNGSPALQVDFSPTELSGKPS